LYNTHARIAALARGRFALAHRNARARGRPAQARRHHRDPHLVGQLRVDHGADHQPQDRTAHRQREDREDGDRVQERVELAREHHVRDQDADTEREPEAARRLLELRGLAGCDDVKTHGQLFAELHDFRHGLGL
jgi:hypothetical protein